MKIFLQDYFDDLKSQVLQKAGIHTISPSDCYQLALAVQKDTQKRISETTLKRIYGFAAAYYQPSTYTLNTLSQYCGCTNWSDFMAHCEQKHRQPAHRDSSWALISQTAHKISRFSIESNKHKSGIPYPMTVRCHSMENQIQQFDDSPAVACVLRGASGSGKTLGLTRWIDARLNQRPKKGQDDIFLFVNAFTLVSSSVFGYHGNHWLSYIIGLPKQDLLDEFMETYRSGAPGKFYLVIDNMHNSPISDRQYQIIFSQLVDMVHYFSSFPWFKIILSIRTPVWQKYRHLIERNPTIQKLWFSNGIDLTGFTQREIQELTANIVGHSVIAHRNSYEKPPLLAHPLYFQIYYQLKGRDITPTDLHISDHYKIWGTFINQYALKGMHYLEKRKLLDRLSRFVIYQDGTLCVDDQKVFSLINQFPKAFKELIASGLLHTHYSDVGSRQISQIRFQSTTAGAYFIAQRLLQKNRNVFDSTLVKALNHLYYPDALKRAVLYWLIIFAMETGHFDLLDLLGHLTFFRSHELALITFIGDYLPDALQENVSEQFHNVLIHRRFVEYVLSYLFVDPAYEAFLNQLLTYRIRDDHRILLHSALGLIALFKLQDEQVAFHLEKMNEVDPSAYAHFSLNPYIQLEALFHYFRYGTISKHALKEITVFSFHPQRNHMFVQHQVLFTLGILVSKLSNGTFKSLRFLRAVQKCQSLTSFPFSAEYLDLMQLIRAREWLKNNNVAKAEAILYTAPITGKHRALIQILHTIYQIELHLAKRLDCISDIQTSISISQKHHISISEAIVRILYLRIFRHHPDHKAEISVQRAALKDIFQKTNFQQDNLERLVAFNIQKLDLSLYVEETTTSSPRTLQNS